MSAQPTSNAPKPLTDDEVEMLEGLLDEFESENHMEAEEMDGFLTAALAPLDIKGQEVAQQTAEWLPFMLGVEADDPRADPQGELGKLIVAHAVSLQYQLETDAGLDPLLTVDDRDRVTGVGWAHGYLRGMSLEMDAWAPLLEDEEEADFLEPMLILTGDGEEGTPKKLSPRQYEELIDAMLGGAAFAYQWYRS